MRSMTAYGSKSVETGGCRVSARLRSVNHRFLDVVLRLPDDIRHLEVGLRQRTAESLSRGRIELRLDVEDRRDRAVEVTVNRAWIRALTETRVALIETGLEVGEVTIRDLLRLPEAVQVSSTRDRPDEELESLVYQAVDGALAELVEARKREGRELEAALATLITSLEEETRAIVELQPLVREELERRYRQRLEDLQAELGDVDENRIGQEIAALIERGDVQEELDRLAAHQVHFRETMGGSGPVGKKLDFLAQEMARELTTVAAKCRHVSVVQRDVDARLICEQIREQIQNIE